MKCDKKEDLEPYMLEMEKSGSIKFSFDKILKPHQDAYSEEDFRQLMTKLSSSKKSISNMLAKGFEQILLLKVLKPSNFGSAPITKYRVLSGTKDQIFADCGENSIRNFINVLIYSPSLAGFDISILETLNSMPGYELLDGLIDFYHEYNDPNQASDTSYYSAWNELISSLNHKVPAAAEERVKYFYQNRFDITGGFSNMKNVLKKVFGHHDLRKLISDVNEISGKNIHFDDHELTDKRSNYGKIYINDGQNEYIWGFQLIHFYFTKQKGLSHQSDPINKIICNINQVAHEELDKKDQDTYCFQPRRHEPYWSLLEVLTELDDR